MIPTLLAGAVGAFMAYHIGDIFSCGIQAAVMTMVLAVLASPKG